MSNVHEIPCVLFWENMELLSHLILVKKKKGKNILVI